MPLLPKDRLSKQDLKEALVAASVGCLDLAGVNLPLSGTTDDPNRAKTLPIVQYLDLALHSRSVIVGGGHKKIVNLAILKSQGLNGQMVLFPNFPLEVRTRIYQLSLPSRLIRIIEDLQPDGTHYMFVTGAERPSIVKASKEALKVLVATQVYRPLFELNTCGVKYYYHPTLDRVRLHTVAPSADKLPTLTLPAALKNPFDLQAIRILNVDLHLMNRYDLWFIEAIVNMPCLKCIHFIGTFEDPIASDESNFHMFLKDVAGIKQYNLFCEDQNGGLLSGGAALDYVMSSLSSPALKMYFVNEWLKQESARQRIPNWPPIVAFYIWLVPLPTTLSEVPELSALTI